MNRTILVCLILKELSKNNRAFQSSDFKVPDEEFYEAINHAVSEGYISRGSILYADDLPDYGMAQLTAAGLTFLNTNCK